MALDTKLQPQPQHNHMLAALAPDVQDRLFPNLELIPLQSGEIINESRKHTHHVYFPTDSIFSLQYLLENGGSTAISLVGNEGCVGISLLLTGGGTTPCQSIVQRAGYAYRLHQTRAKDEFNRHGKLMLMTLRYTQSLITQYSQAAACYRHHSISEQLCRWLLASLDRSPAQNHLSMTQEFIGNMLGVRRESVTEAATKLQRLGVITYSRGSITVINRPKLESLACECYQAVKAETDLLLDYLQPHYEINNADAVSTAQFNSHQVMPPRPQVVTIRKSIPS